MVDIEPVQFPVRGQIDSSLSLHVENDSRGVHQRGFTWKRRQPFRDGIRSYGRRENSRLAMCKASDLIIRSETGPSELN